ncbi:MAG: radical SAM protein [Phycisphaerae bacterium]|jgi:putative pyruvate formate lyase activating enzyme
MDEQAHKQAGERAKAARKALANCKFCPRQCGVDRTKGQRGYCGLDDAIRCFREVVYCGEEREIIPSHQVHFTGCNLRCEYCLVSEWNEHPFAADEMNLEKMAKRIARRQREGAKTLNLLGGEPAVNLLGILELLSRVDPKVRIVWNSNMYYNDIVNELMTGLAEVYLADLKCGNSDCAESLLGARDYVTVAKRNILKSCKHADVIVRHVLIPGHSECCLKPILKWLAEEIPKVKLSLRVNYIPPAGAVTAPTRYLESEEIQGATALAQSMGLRLIE